MKAHIIELTPVYMQSSDELLGSAILRKFQKELVDMKDGAIILSAPTGSGKTVTLLTDPERGAAIGLYPNNELLCSQVAGLDKFIRKYLGMKSISSSLLSFCISSEGLEVSDIPLNIYEATESVDIFGRMVSRIYVIGLSGKVITGIFNKGKLEILVEVSNRLRQSSENDYIIILGTPDTFFLLSLYLYQNFEELGKLLSLLRALPSDISVDDVDDVLRESRFARSKLERMVQVLLPLRFRESTLFVDEYHLYDFYEIASFKALAYVLKHAHGWDGRIVFSSATPRREFVDSVVKEFELHLREIDAISQVKECGEDYELVRGPMKLMFYGVDVGEGGHVAKLYRSSEFAYELLDKGEFRGFIEAYRSGRARSIVILEKVSHAELFAEELYSKYGVKPICLYSMSRSDICSPQLEDYGTIIVGTGAKIGQGVEYEGITFGVVARVTAADFLQSISRIGRKYPGETTVLVPLDVKIIEKGEGILKERGRITYRRLAHWVEEETKPLLRMIPKGYEEIYKNLIEVREKVLKAIGLILHYRLTQAYSKNLEIYSKALEAFKSLVTLAQPDTLHSLLLFRATGPTVAFAREINGRLECRENEFGTIIRNYEVKAPKDEICACGVINRKPAIMIESIKRGKLSDIVVKCEEGSHLENFIQRYGNMLIVEWEVFKELFKCKCVLRRLGVLDSEVMLKELEEELNGQLFLIPRLLSDEFADYIYKTGRGLKVKIRNTAIALVYI